LSTSDARHRRGDRWTSRNRLALLLNSLARFFSAITTPGQADRVDARGIILHVWNSGLPPSWGAFLGGRLFLFFCLLLGDVDNGNGIAPVNENELLGRYERVTHPFFPPRSGGTGGVTGCGIE